MRDLRGGSKRIRIDLSIPKTVYGGRTYNYDIMSLVGRSAARVGLLRDETVGLKVENLDDLYKQVLA